MIPGSTGTDPHGWMRVRFGFPFDGSSTFIFFSPELNRQFARKKGGVRSESPVIVTFEAQEHW